MSTRPTCINCDVLLRKWTTAVSISRHLTDEGIRNHVAEFHPGFEITNIKKSPHNHVDTWVGLWDGRSWGYDRHGHFHSMRCAAEYAELAIQKQLQYRELNA